MEWERHLAGAAALDRFGVTLPDPLLESIRRNKVALKGPVATPVGGGFTSVNVGLRKALDLFANLRPVKSLPGVQSRYQASTDHRPGKHGRPVAGLEHDEVVARRG